jgi:hypothetical protein
VLEGKSLPVNFNSYITMLQSTTGTNININIARAVSRLKTVFITLDNATNNEADKGFTAKTTISS